MLNNVQSTLIDALQELRDRLNTPVRIVSGCRCEKRNRQVGGETYSKHLYGLAADIVVRGTPTIHVLMVAELVPAFMGFGYRASTLHLDVAARTARTYWEYTDNGIVVRNKALWDVYQQHRALDTLPDVGTSLDVLP